MPDAITPPTRANPRTSQPPPAVDLPPRSSWPDFLAFFLFMAGISVLLSIVIPARDLTLGLNGGMAMTSIFLGFKGFRYGLLQSLVAMGRFGASIFLGYWGKEWAEGILGIHGLLGTFAGFYLIFFAFFFLSGITLRFILPERKSPTLPDSLLGAIFGLAEGVIFFILIGGCISLMPGAPANGKSIPEVLGSDTAKAVMEKVVPRLEGTPLAFVKLAQDAKKGIDPQKIDRETLLKEFRPLHEHPKIKAIQNDPEIFNLAQKRDIQGLLKNPKIIEMLTDPELQKIGENIHWEAVESAIRKGIGP